MAPPPVVREPEICDWCKACSSLPNLSPSAPEPQQNFWQQRLTLEDRQPQGRDQIGKSANRQNQQTGKSISMAVIIVGAGPTGAGLAYLLARRGVEVILVEAAGVERVFRGEGLMPGGLQALEQMQLLDLLATIPTQQIWAWEFVVNNQTVVRAREPESLGLFRPTIISQTAFLEALLHRMQAFPNLRFVRGSVQDLIWQDERVAGVVVRPTGQSQTGQPQTGQLLQLQAQLVIGADGRGSTLRRLADLPLTKLDYDTDLLWFRLPQPLPVDCRPTFYGFISGSESFGAYSSWDTSLKLAYLLPRRPIAATAPASTAASNPRPNRTPADWATHLASLAPDWFATHLRQHAADLEPPVPLNVVFGRCQTWHRPGLLLLGDAAHPMAPIRAQGINVALRDVIVAANQLLPLLQSQASDRALDEALPLIQAEREPEIKRCQTLQHREQHQADLLCRVAALRGSVALVAPLLRPAISQRWMARQTELRFGTEPVELRV